MEFLSWRQYVRYEVRMTWFFGWPQIFINMILKQTMKCLVLMCFFVVYNKADLLEFVMGPRLGRSVREVAKSKNLEVSAAVSLVFNFFYPFFFILVEDVWICLKVLDNSIFSKSVLKLFYNKLINILGVNGVRNTPIRFSDWKFFFLKLQLRIVLLVILSWLDMGTVLWS